LSAAEYDVLSAYIAEKFGAQKGQGSVTNVVVLNMTQSDELETFSDENGKPVPWIETAKALQQDVPRLQRTTIDAFRKANSLQAPLHPAFHAGIACHLVDSAQIDSIFKKDGGGWSSFHRLFHGSWEILRLSRVGFNMDGTQALFFISNRCEGLCGCGNYVAMEKRNGHWAIVSEIVTWIS